MTEKPAVYEVQQSTALTVPEIMSIGEVMAKSGYFDDARQAAQAVVKIMAGRELGFGPFASMTGVSIIKGKPVITANLMAGAVRAHPRYDYKVIALDDNACTLAFYRDGVEVGRSKFDREDATAAEVGRMVAPGTSGSMIKRFPRNMLFARAMSNGVRWYCPDVFTGAAVYTPDELGEEDVTAEVLSEQDIEDITDGVPVQATVTEDASEPEVKSKPKQNGRIKRPAPPETVRSWLRTKAAKGSTGSANEKQIGLLAGKIGEALQNRDDKPRHLVYNWLWGTERSALLPRGAIQAMLDWLVMDKDEETGDYPLHPDATQELLAMYKQAQLDAGQQEMEV